MAWLVLTEVGSVDWLVDWWVVGCLVLAWEDDSGGGDILRSVGSILGTGTELARGTETSDAGGGETSGSGVTGEKDGGRGELGPGVVRPSR